MIGDFASKMLNASPWEDPAIEVWIHLPEPHNLPFVNGIGRTCEVALHRACLVVRWLTICGYIILICSCPLSADSVMLHSDCTIVAIVSLQAEVEYCDFNGSIYTAYICSDHIVTIARPYLWDPAKSKRAWLWARLRGPRHGTANHGRAHLNLLVNGD